MHGAGIHSHQKPGSRLRAMLVYVPHCHIKQFREVIWTVQVRLPSAYQLLNHPPSFLVEVLESELNFL